MNRRSLFLIAGVAVACLVAFGIWRSISSREQNGSGVPVVPQVAQDKAASPMSPKTTATESCPFRFATVPENGGITFRHNSGTSAEKPFPAANGSGIAALDFDRDGLLDLCFGTGTPFPIDASRAAPHNQMYRNGGEWAFEDVTAVTGVGHNGFTAGLAVGDFDNDGFPDLFLGCFGPDVLYHNCGDGTFERVVAGVEDPRWGTSAAFFDFDHDGLLDLYVCNYGKWTYETNQFCGNREKHVRIFCSPHSIDGVRSSLFRNLGDGQFADVTDSVGAGSRIARSQGVIAADFNQDGLTDFYVGNDLHANSLFINTGHGTFDDATEISGTGYDDRGRMQAGMGVDVADVNGDGEFDLFVTNFEDETNSLYENQGGNSYKDSSQQSGLANGSLPWVGWGCAIRDFDLDGEDDVWVVNGHVDDNLKDMGRDAPYREPSLIWHNQRGRFKLHGAAIGDYFAAPHAARALVVADFDNDGDWDGVVGHQDEVPSLLRNERLAAGSDGRTGSLVLELIGTRSNRDAIGATVTLKIGDRQLKQLVRGGGSYLSAPDRRLIFAIPNKVQQVIVEIQWPGGERSSGTLPSASGGYQIVEPAAKDSSLGIIRSRR